MLETNSSELNFIFLFLLWLACMVFKLFDWFLYVRSSACFAAKEPYLSSASNLRYGQENVPIINWKLHPGEISFSPDARNFT